MKRDVVRDLSGQIRKKFNAFDCVVLLGPRQVGKTYLSRWLIKENGPNSLYELLPVSRTPS